MICEFVRVNNELKDTISADGALTDSREHMATILYARVSSTEQTIDHQRTQAEQAGFKSR